MFNSLAFQGVDAVQTAKKQFVSTFVQNEQIKDALNGFIEAQASYTKEAITAGSVAVTKVTETFTDRTLYVKLAEQVQAFFPTMAGTKTAKKASK